MHRMDNLNRSFADNGQLYITISTRDMELRNMDDDDLNEYGRQCVAIHLQAVARDAKFRECNAQNKMWRKQAEEEYNRKLADKRFREKMLIDELFDEIKKYK